MLLFVLQNAAAAASDKPEAAENALALYDYKQQQVWQLEAERGGKVVATSTQHRAAGHAVLDTSACRTGSLRSEEQQTAAVGNQHSMLRWQQALLLQQLLHL
jgi:glutamate 5-kinase